MLHIFTHGDTSITNGFRIKIEISKLLSKQCHCRQCTLTDRTSVQDGRRSILDGNTRTVRRSLCRTMCKEVLLGILRRSMARRACRPGLREKWSGWCTWWAAERCWQRRQAAGQRRLWWKASCWFGVVGLMCLIWSLDLGCKFWCVDGEKEEIGASRSLIYRDLPCHITHRIWFHVTCSLWLSYLSKLPQSRAS